MPSGTYNALRIDSIAEGSLDPSRDFSPSFGNSSCAWSSITADQANPLMTLTFKGSTWWAPQTGWVKKIGTLSDSHGEIKSYEMELESIEAP